MLPDDIYKMQRAIFLDKDGTLVTDVPYNVNPSLVTLEKGVLEGLAALQASSFLLVIVSNQPGISMGLFSEEQLKLLISYLTNLFKNNHISLSGFYYCPHVPAPEPVCKCRKPSPGLLTQAARDLNIDLSKSWMIGDILNDVEAGVSAGCDTVLINNGNETEWIVNQNRIPDHLADNFLDAANYILSKQK